MDDFEEKNNIGENRIDDFIRDIKNNPNKIIELWERARKYQDSKKYKEASEIYSELVFISLEPTTKDLVKNNQRGFIFFHRGECYYSLKIYESAIEDFTISKDIDEIGSHRNTQSLFLRGECYFKLKMYEMAIEDFTKVIDDPDTREGKSLFLRGECYFKLGMHDEADADFYEAFNIFKEYLTVDEMRPFLMDLYKNDKLF